TVMALVMAVAMPSFRGRADSVTARREAATLVNELRLARSAALTNATGAGLEFDLARRTLRPTGGVARRLPPDVVLSVDTTRSQLLGESAGRIWFYPDGSSTGGRVTVAAGRRVYRIDIDWVTGRVAAPTN
ncbi:MAG: Tfp pilus assembly protein FimT/FimU, partial [Candidatus Eiseniibacteriota bacterium]